MQQAFYSLIGPCAGDGCPLLGVYHWSTGVRLERVSVTARAGFGEGWSFPTVIGLMINGVMSAVTVGIVGYARGGDIDFVATLRINGIAGVAIPANAELRWARVSGPAATEDAAMDISLVVEVGPMGEGSAGYTGLEVRWVGAMGMTPLPLYEFNPATNGFDEVTPGIATGKASVAGGSNFTATIDGTLAAKARADGVNVNLLWETGALGGLTAADFPALEFWIGPDGYPGRVATLTKSGVMRVLSATEPASLAGVSAGDDRFRFYFGGVLKGVLGGFGLGLQAGVSEVIS